MDLREQRANDGKQDQDLVSQRQPPEISDTVGPSYLTHDCYIEKSQTEGEEEVDLERDPRVASG
jgi:hypothetical protein